jgi:hypothetical protein
MIDAFRLADNRFFAINLEFHRRQTLALARPLNTEPCFGIEKRAMNPADQPRATFIEEVSFTGVENRPHMRTYIPVSAGISSRRPDEKDMLRTGFAGKLMPRFRGVAWFQIANDNPCFSS